MRLEIPVIIQEVKTMVDQGFRLKIDTNELSPEEATRLFSFKGKEIMLTLVDDGE